MELAPEAERPKDRGLGGRDGRDRSRDRKRMAGKSFLTGEARAEIEKAVLSGGVKPTR